MREGKNNTAPNLVKLGTATWTDRARMEARSLAKVGSPILVVQLLQVSVMAIDTVMAGRYSAQDLSGVAIGGSIWFPVFLFLFGLLSALTPTVAQLHGAGKYDEIPKNVYQNIWLALVISPISMALVVFLDPLLKLVGAENSIRSITIGYLNAMALGLPPLLLFNTLRFYSDGVSLTKPAVAASFIGLLINAPLNYVLIYGKFGFPALGGVGCGWASTISFYVMFVCMALTVAYKRAYRPFFLYRKVFGPHWPTLINQLKVGLPIGLAHFVEASMFSVIALFLASLGPTVVAAHQIALNVSALVFMVPLSLSVALTIRTGFLIGSGESNEARFTAFFGLLLAVVYACISACLLYLFRFNIAGFYNTEQAVIALAGTLLVYAAVFQLGDALQVTAAGALRGYKDTRSAMVIMVITFWCFGLPLGYVLGLTDYFGPPQHAEGFWSGLVVGLFLAGGLLILRLQKISLPSNSE